MLLIPILQQSNLITYNVYIFFNILFYYGLL